MKNLKTLLILTAMLTGAASTYAASPAGAPMAAGEAKKEAPAAVSTDMAEMADGEVRKVDMENKKITIKHGAIKNLDMPGMTMVFQVKDVVMLSNIKVGDSVRFKAEKASGAILVTALQIASSPDTGKAGLTTTQPIGVMAPVSATSKETAVSNSELTDGEIRKVDLANNKVTIKHEEIKNLDMPGMTMVFQVKDVAMLDKAKVGDKIRFKAEKAGGAIVVTDIQPTK